MPRREARATTAKTTAVGDRPGDDFNPADDLAASPPAARLTVVFDRDDVNTATTRQRPASVRRRTSAAPTHCSCSRRRRCSTPIRHSGVRGVHRPRAQRRLRTRGVVAVQARLATTIRRSLRIQHHRRIRHPHRPRHHHLPHDRSGSPASAIGSAVQWLGRATGCGRVRCTGVAKDGKSILMFCSAPA